MGRIETSDLKRITSEPMVGKAKPLNESEKALLSECMQRCAQKGLSARIWKNLHLAWLFKNDQNPELSWENGAQWKPWKSPTPTFPPFPLRLEIPQKTRDSHISPATTAAGPLYPQRSNPPKSQSSSDFCVEQKKGIDSAGVVRDAC